jgi:hypothetical protein
MHPPRILLAALLFAGMAGAQEASPRWLVTLGKRGFDLAPLREAIVSGRDAAAVGAIVAGLEAKAREDQQEVARLVEDLGGRVTRQWWIVSGCAVELPEAQLAKLRAHPRVVAVEPDELMPPADASPPIKDATNAKNHNVDALQANGIKGQGVAIAIIDSGQDEKAGSAPRPHATYFVNGDTLNLSGGGIAGSRLVANFKVGGMPADDITGHGTGVAGVAAGEKWESGPASDRGHAPLASIVGYSLADDMSANTLYSTVISAWQKVASDRAAYKIVAANNSYVGSPSPTHLSQQALDSAAWNADLLVTVAAANFGSSTFGSQSAANGLAVGAVWKDTHEVAEFSSRGPLHGDAQRYYPDLVGNGVNVVTPLRDDERTGSAYTTSGTSFAAPQVAGAAVLFRSVRTSATALETKAAILATCDDVSGRNLHYPVATRNAYGLGYLRDDRLVALAQGSGLVLSDAATLPGQKKSYLFAVQAGRWYSAVVSWPRLDVTSAAWSNLDLRAFDGQAPLAASTTPRNLYEKVVWQAAASGTHRIEVEAVALDAPSVPFALAASEVPAPYLPGSVTSYGQACAGTGYSYTVPAASPSVAHSAFGGASSDQPLGSEDCRMQIVFAPAAVPYALSANGVAFRHDEAAWAPSLPYSFELGVEMGTAAVLPAAITQSFAGNVAGTPVAVLVRKRVSIEPPASVNGSPASWAYRIPYDQPFVWLPLPGKGLVWQCTHQSTSPGFGDQYRLAVDAYQDPSASPLLSSLSALSPTAGTGTAKVGFGPVLGWLLLGTGGAYPSLSAIEPPNVGNGYTLRLAQGAPACPGVLQLGWSELAWGSLALPLDLSPFGAPGCSLLASGELQIPFVSDGSGRASFELTIPASVGIVGGNLRQQVLLLDPGANAMGLSASAGLRTVTGGPR